MSVIAYGRIASRLETPRPTAPTLLEGADLERAQEEEKEKEKENKLIAGIAALVPAEIIALHMLILSKTTTTSADGITKITNESALRWSLPILLGVAAIGFAIARGTKPAWTGRDWVRLFMPLAAFVAWAALIGTSALSPWVKGLDGAWLVVAAGGIAFLLISINARVNPQKKEDTSGDPKSRQ